MDPGIQKAAIRDADGNVVYEKAADANNFYVANRNSTDEPTWAGLTSWSNERDVTPGKTLDRIEDSWTYDNPAEQMALLLHLWKEANGIS